MRSDSCLEESCSVLPSRLCAFREPTCTFSSHSKVMALFIAESTRIRGDDHASGFGYVANCLDTFLTLDNSYMFDEPSSYLDVKQRLNAARTIRSLLKPSCFVIVVEHDLSVLDYLSDFICVLYGVPSVYGVVTLPFSVREGINIFLDGKVPTENLRFREESLTFRLAETADEVQDNQNHRRYKYPKMTKTMGDFKLHVEPGQFTDSEIVVMLGENGTGKTTFIRLLAGILKPDGEQYVPELNVSYKPQKIAPKFQVRLRAFCS